MAKVHNFHEFNDAHERMLQARFEAAVERNRDKIESWPYDHPERNAYVEGLADAIA